MAVDVWSQCRAQLKKELSSADFETWIGPLHARLEESGITLVAQNPHVRKRVHDQFLPRIQSLIDELGDPRNPLLVEVDTGYSERPTGVPQRASRIPQATQNRLNKSLTFESFIEGSSNGWAKTAAQRVALEEEQDYNPLLLYGGVGLGKTHLMHSVGNAIHAQDPRREVLYMLSHQFVNDLVKALHTGAIGQFSERLRRVDVLLMDDIQFFAGKSRSQEEFFHLFNQLSESGCRMIFACDRFPREIDRLDERLNSRLLHGLSAEVKPPDLETRAAILMYKSAQRGVTLTTGVALHIAKHVTGNVRELEGILHGLLLSTEYHGYDMTISHVDEILRNIHYARPRQVTIDKILSIVTEFYNVNISDVRGRGRPTRIARARHMAMALARKLTDLSYQSIGEAIGNRDHTTVLHAVKAIERLREKNTEVEADWKHLEAKLSP